MPFSGSGRASYLLSSDCRQEQHNARRPTLTMPQTHKHTHASTQVSHWVPSGQCWYCRPSVDQAKLCTGQETICGANWPLMTLNDGGGGGGPVMSGLSRLYEFEDDCARGQARKKTCMSRRRHARPLVKMHACTLKFFSRTEL